jgi:hypothetical protein
MDDRDPRLSESKVMATSGGRGPVTCQAGLLHRIPSKDSFIGPSDPRYLGGAHDHWLACRGRLSCLANTVSAVFF